MHVATAEDVAGLTVFVVSAVSTVDTEALLCSRANKDRDTSASAPEEFLLFFLSSPWTTDAEAETEPEDDVANIKEGSLSLNGKRGFEDEEEEKEAEDDIEIGPERRR